MEPLTANGKKRGRPTKFTQALADRICLMLANGKSLHYICRVERLAGRSTIFRWLRDNPGFRDQYAQAREDQADALFDEILQIADDGTNDTQVDDDGKVRVDYDHIHRSRLRVDARKWILARLAPKKYGKLVEEEAGDGEQWVVIKRVKEPAVKTEGG